MVIRLHDITMRMREEIKWQSHDNKIISEDIGIGKVLNIIVENIFQTYIEIVM